ncbi:MAG: hypothetical protein HY984_02085 [Candidatus Magasanikbacteria bacterium]|nr:hypothetical protein [Candidatus Magasanikbacteria bacterium]
MAALRRDWRVIFLCGPARPKFFREYPLLEPLPANLGFPGIYQVTLVSYCEVQELPQIVERHNISDIVSTDIREDDFGHTLLALGSSGVSLHGLQWYADYLAMSPSVLSGFTNLFVYTTQMLDIYRQAYPACPAAIINKFQAVGNPVLDCLARLREQRLELRAKYRVPVDKPVILLLTQNVPFCEANNRWTWIAKDWRRRQSSWREKLFDVQYHDIIRAIRRWCTANNALLVVKSRAKHAEPTCVLRAADLFITDTNQWYPTQSLELLALSNLTIGMWSTSVIEAAAMGVHNITVELPMRFDSAIPSMKFFVDALFSFPGVTTRCRARELPELLARHKLGDFTVAQDSRQTYLQRFAGPVDGLSAERILDLVRQ